MGPAIEHWRRSVETHHAQSARIQADSMWQCGDFWQPLASIFRADPHRTDDQVLNRLAREVGPDKTVLDVGGGAGRFALPLALRCRHVTVVEPSESMVRELRTGAHEARVANLSIVQESWEEAKTGQADLVLGAQVVYGTAEIEPFIRKLESHAKERVLLLVFMKSPLSLFSPFWEAVHGEEREELPALPELLDGLWEMGIYPDLEMLKSAGHDSDRSRGAALEFLRHMMFVRAETEQDRLLERAIDELLVDTPEGFGARWFQAPRLALVSWRP